MLCTVVAKQELTEQCYSCTDISGWDLGSPKNVLYNQQGVVQNDLVVPSLVTEG